MSIAETVRQPVSIDLTECGIEPGQDQFLLRDGEPSVADTADRPSVRAFTVSKMADHLCRKDWTTRHADAEDRRRVRLRLTVEGTTVAETVDRLHTRLERELWTALGRDATTMPILTRVDGVLAGLLRRLR